MEKLLHKAHTNFYPRMQAVEHSNKLTILCIAVLVASIASIANLLVQNYLRLTTTGISSILLATALVLEWRIPHNNKSTLLAACGVSTIFIPPIIFNAGLSDGRGILSLSLYPVWMLLILGVHRANFVAISTAILTIIMIILNATELNTYLNIPDLRYDTQKEVLIYIGLSATALAYWQVGRVLSSQLIAIKSEALKALERQNSESRFLQRMSHELRNPLNGIIGLTKIAKTEHDTTIIMELLSEIDSASEHLHAVINEILDFKKIDAEAFKIHIKSFNLKDNLETESRVYKKLCDRKGITYLSQTNFESIPTAVLGDSTRLKQARENIFGNALKFTPFQGKITVFSHYDHSKEIWEFSVSDTGPGLSDISIGNLFKPYSQVTDDQELSSQGSGLGLAITKEIANRMGGNIFVKSEPGKGSNFKLIIPLPLSHESQQPVSHGNNKINEEKKSHPPLQGCKILCIDDSPINLKVICRPIEKAGASTFAITNPYDALEILQYEDINLVLTDISMPIMNGDELMLKIKQLKPELPVLAITGHVLEEDLNNFILKGFSDVICKPFSSENLVKILSFNINRN